MAASASFLSTYPRQSLAFGACIALFVGLICSKFLMTLAMIALLLVGLGSPNLKQDWKQLVARKALLVSSISFAIFLWSALLSSNQGEALTRLRIALPLLVLPIAFGLLPSFSKRQYQLLLMSFFYLMMLAGLGVWGYYWIHYEEVQGLLIVSKAVPTPNGDHIRFSLMLNLAIAAGIYLLQQGFYWKNSLERWFFLLGVLFLCFLLHILAVRIGLVVLYFNCALLLLYYILTKRHYLIGTLLFLTGLSLPFLAYQYIPSVRTKVDLTRHNFHLYQAGKIGNYSDTQRLLSYQIAWEVAQQSPLVGVGIADLHDEQRKIYEQSYPEQRVMYPHNFFLTLYAGTGLLGLLFFSACFLFPFLYKRRYKDLFVLLFFSTIFLSFLTENTLLTAIGVAVYSLFLGMAMNAANATTNTES